MIASQIYTIDLPNDEDFASNGLNMMVIATVFQCAISKHVSIYHKKEIPLSFVEFYLTEIRKYDYMFKKETKKFFESFDSSNPNIEILAEIYRKSYFSQIKKIKTINKEKYLILPNLAIIDYSGEITRSSSKEVADTVSNILKITEHINNSDEIVDYNKCFESYIISKVIQ